MCSQCIFRLVRNIGLEISFKRFFFLSIKDAVVYFDHVTSESFCHCITLFPNYLSSSENSTYLRHKFLCPHCVHIEFLFLVPKSYSVWVLAAALSPLLLPPSQPQVQCGEQTMEKNFLSQEGRSVDVLLPTFPRPLSFSQGY